jgi:hypothetical protein
MDDQTERPIDDALYAIATRAGDDLVLLAPPTERHFDPFSATAAFAVLLVVHYLDGLTRSLTKGAEDAGEATGERIKRSLRKLFSGHSDVTRDEAVKAVADASGAVREMPERVSVARDAARMRLMDALVENGLPVDRAFALLSQVQEETDTLIGADKP